MPKKTMRNEKHIRNVIFQEILDMSSDGFLITDKEGYIMDINKAYLDFLALKREDVVGKYVLEVIKNSKLPEIMLTGQTDVNVLHKLAEGQSPKKEKYVAVTRSPVWDGSQVIASVGQIKFSRETRELAEKMQQIDGQLQYYKNELKRIARTRYSFETLIGQSEEFSKVKTIAQRAARNDFSVLITGDTGTGKEVFAHAIHYESERRNQPFIRVNCAAIPADLLESELFGYEEGSFTGAKKGGKPGKFVLADHGTIFLDEIGDMPLNMQVKLLRVLQEKEVEPVGAIRPIPINVRIISATNQNLEEKIKDKSFRSDLYYRLNVIQLKIPSLSERPEDIPLFIHYFLDELNQYYGTKINISPDSEKLLQKYNWPGNIRELKNMIERAYAMVDHDMILPLHFPANITGKLKIDDIVSKGRSLETVLNEVEREILLSVLKKNNNNCRLAAKELGIHRATFYKKLDKFHIERQYTEE